MAWLQGLDQGLHLGWPQHRHLEHYFDAFEGRLEPVVEDLKVALDEIFVVRAVPSSVLGFQSFLAADVDLDVVAWGVVQKDATWAGLAAKS
jgi:hypothetical protein